MSFAKCKLIRIKSKVSVAIIKFNSNMMVLSFANFETNTINKAFMDG